MARESANVTALTPCNRRCADCCCGDVVFGAGRIFAVDAIAREVAAFAAFDEVVLTGGEPTLHPEFPAVAEAARRARGPKRLRLITNGARLVRHAAATRFFDVVSMSIFTATSNAGPPTDPGIVDAYRAVCPAGVVFDPHVVTHYRTLPLVRYGGGAKPCGREKVSVSAMDGRVFGCCVASGIAGADSTDMSPGWEARLASVALPCDRCVFGVP